MTITHTIKSHLGETSTEYGKRPHGAPWLDFWTTHDGYGRTLYLRVGGVTRLWSSPAAFRRGT